MKKALYLLFVCHLLGACLSTEPKNFTKDTTNTRGQTRNPGNNSNLSEIKISYASLYRRNSSATTYYVAMQFASESGAAVSNTCGSSGTNCYCDFFTSGSSSVSSSSGGDSSKIKLYANGNIITCEANANVSSVRIRNAASTTVSPTVSVNSDTTGLSLSVLLGGLNAGYARSVYSYKCDLYSRQKTGTTPGTGFNCSDQGASDYNMLKTTYNYYVYTDNYTSAIGYRSTDHMFEDGQSCGFMAKQLDCTSTNVGYLTLDFGLYGLKSGIFSEPIVAYTGPPLGLIGYTPGFSTTLGYAASTSNFLGAVCPLGFEERTLNTITPASTFSADMGNTSGTEDNELVTLEDKRIILSSTTADTTCKDAATAAGVVSGVTDPCIRVKRTTVAGDCDVTGKTCTLPTLTAADVTDYRPEKWPMTTVVNSTFCSLNKTLLP